jgi:hypothetical protein
MEKTKRPHKVVIHRCPECKDTYKLGMKIDCIECGKYLCYDCAVFENDESGYMMCPHCFKAQEVKKELLEKNILYPFESSDFAVIIRK